jgi:hypothetical protein
MRFSPRASILSLHSREVMLPVTVPVESTHWEGHDGGVEPNLGADPTHLCARHLRSTARRPSPLNLFYVSSLSSRLT